MAITIPMVPEASNKGNREKKNEFCISKHFYYGMFICSVIMKQSTSVTFEIQSSRSISSVWTHSTLGSGRSKATYYLFGVVAHISVSLEIWQTIS